MYSGVGAGRGSTTESMVFGRWVMGLMAEEREDLGGVCLDLTFLLWRGLHKTQGLTYITILLSAVLA
jgi:hypothetical protein